MASEAVIATDFFDQPGALRLQFEWFAAISARQPGSDGPQLPDGDSPLAASADQIFSEQTLWNFLSDLRNRAGAPAGSLSHASTPRLQAFVRLPLGPPGPPPAATGKVWRYAFSLCSGALIALTVIPASARLLAAAGGRVLGLPDNCLALLPPGVSYSIHRSRAPSAERLRSRPVVLEGFLW